MFVLNLYTSKLRFERVSYLQKSHDWKGADSGFKLRTAWPPSLCSHSDTTSYFQWQDSELKARQPDHPRGDLTVHVSTPGAPSPASTPFHSTPSDCPSGYCSRHTARTFRIWKFSVSICPLGTATSAGHHGQQMGGQ